MLFNNSAGYWIVGSILLGLIVWVSWSVYITAVTEEVPYTVIDNSKEYEIREYEYFILAEVETEGGITSGGNSAFSILFNYISGQNENDQKIAMTTPVISEPIGEKIAMTAPVIQDKNTFSFVLPKEYTLENAPKPKDSRIKLREIKNVKVAVLRFSGSYSDSNFEQKKIKLDSYLQRDGKDYSKMSSATYNPPGIPPFLRRLEVWAYLE